MQHRGQVQDQLQDRISLIVDAESLRGQFRRPSYTSNKTAPADSARRRDCRQGYVKRYLNKPPQASWLLLLAALELCCCSRITGARIVRAPPSACAPGGCDRYFRAAEYSAALAGFPGALDHGYEYSAGMAPVVITTEARRSTEFSEGGVGRDYLLRRGFRAGSDCGDASSTRRSRGGWPTSCARTACTAALRSATLFMCSASRSAGARRRAGGTRAQTRVASASPGDRFVAVMREAASYLAWKRDVLALAAGYYC